jgi:hypothetical protein
MHTDDQERPGKRFSADYQPQHNGRTPTAWLRRKLDAAARDGDQTLRDKIFEHLVEVATKWEIVVKGRDPDGAPIEVASARDAVEAAKLLFSYDFGRPREEPEATVPVPGGIATEGRPLLDILADMYRARLVAGDLAQSEIHKLTDLVLSIDQAKIALVFKLLGKDPGKNAEEILALVDRSPAALAADAATPPPEPTP